MSQWQSLNFGHSAGGLVIPAFRWEATGPEILLLGGVHGDEPEGVHCAWGLHKAIAEGALGQGTDATQLNLTLIPEFNPDGVRAGKRVNGHGVDLNRNMPSTDWDPKAFNDRYPPGPQAGSEPETQALLAHFKKCPPVFILSLHSWKPMLNVNGDCAAEAQAIHALTGYTIEPTVGYPTPGSLGTYAGIERGMPTLTYEIERGIALSEVIRVHVPAVIAGLRVAARRGSR